MDYFEASYLNFPKGKEEGEYDSGRRLTYRNAHLC